MENDPRRTVRRTLWAAALLIALGGLLTLGTSGCGKASHAVDYCGQKDAYAHAHDTYKTGEKVRLTYPASAADTDRAFYLDGEPLEPDYEDGKGFILRFTMPDRDVKLECRASSVTQAPTQDADREDVMLLDFYTATVAAADDDGGHLEMALYTTVSGKWKLLVYRQESQEEPETCTAYNVPYMAVDKCFAILDEENVRAWNDEPTDGEEGAVTVCKFRDTDGTYVRVTSEAMPEGGARAFARIRETLQSYATDAYRA